MNLKELKSHVDTAVENAIEYGSNPSDVLVSVQIGGVFTDEIEFHYDNDGCASGAVIVGEIGNGC